MELLIVALVLALRFALRRADARRWRVSTWIAVADSFGLYPGMMLSICGTDGDVRYGRIRRVDGDAVMLYMERQ